MKKINILFGVFVAAILLVSCESIPLDALLQGIQKPTVESVESRVEGIDLRGVKLAFDVKVNNPNSFAIRKAKFDYAIEIEGKDFLDTEHDADVDIPAQETGTVTLPARLKFIDMYRAYGSLQGKSEVDYIMKGNLIIAGIRIPMKNFS